MAINKNAVLRYNVLDKCFQNFGRQYSFDDLLEIVNAALLEDNPKSSGIQVRQLRDDIRFMKSEAGYSAPIESSRDGGKPYYRYSEKDFSINNRPINETEAEQLKMAISVLQRFEGSPQFEWVSELTPMLKDQFGLSESSERVMAFDSNIDYSGYEHITVLFNAIVNKVVLEIEYQPFGKEGYKMKFHPYYLKQYNNRWFVFGRNEYNEVNTWNLALDRIQSIKSTGQKYISCDIDWEDYFYDMIGVSRNEDSALEEVLLVFDKEQAPYIHTKPLHPSQKVRLLDSGELEVRLNLIVNYELEMRLLSYGEKVEIKSPGSLKKRIVRRIQDAIKQYKK